MKVIQIKKYNDNLVSIYIHNLKLKIKTWRCMALEILIRLGEQHDQDFIIPIRSYVFLFFCISVYSLMGQIFLSFSEAPFK